MSILSRFRDVMRMNVNSLLEQANDPEQTVDEYMRRFQTELGQLRAETAAVLADERRARLALDEGEAEIRKLQRYAEKSVEAGREEEARRFLERKIAQQAKLADLQAAYEQAEVKAQGMKQMQDKLFSDLNRLELRRAELKGKLAEAKLQQQLNEASGADSAFARLEDQATLALDEAIALAELRGGVREDDLDTLIARLEQAEAGKGASSGSGSSGSGKLLSPEDELAAIKANLHRKE
jgi:phage shock protein A